jgi:formate-dependent nitrite reductase membrane component NrfD
MTSPQTPPADDLAERRKRALRTAFVVGAIAVAVYAGFIIAGVIGS